jgi:hypothetical protein
MDEQKAGGVDAEADVSELKTRLARRGTWRATRRHRTACGTSLESITAAVLEEGALVEKLDLAWLNAPSLESR